MRNNNRILQGDQTRCEDNFLRGGQWRNILTGGPWTNYIKGPIPHFAFTEEEFIIIKVLTKITIKLPLNTKQR